MFKSSHLSVPCIWSPFFIKGKVELGNAAPNPKHSNLSHPVGILRLNPIFPVHSPGLRILACISMQSTLFLISNLSHWLFLRLRLIFADHIFYISLPPVSASLMLLSIPAPSNPTATDLKSEKGTEQSTQLLKRNVLNSHHSSTWL